MIDSQTQQTAEVLRQISQLPEQNHEPPQFFANFLQLAATATCSRGGAIWVAQPPPGQEIRCYCHIDLELCGVKDEQQKRLVTEAVGRALREGKTLVVPAGGELVGGSLAGGAEGERQVSENKCQYPLFFKPLRAGDQTAMVLQIIGNEGLTPHDFRAAVAVLDQSGQAAERYLAHRRASVLQDDRKALAGLLKYTEGIHDSLDPERVVYQAANLGRDTIGCSRVAVWIDPQVQRGLRAVSGVDKPDRRAILIQSIEKVCKHCLEIEKPIVAARSELAQLPEDDPLTPLLKQYFHVSQLDHIFLEPMKAKDRYVGVMVAEGFDEAPSANVAGLLATVARHAAVALENAIQMASVPLVRPFARLQKVKQDPKKRRKWLIVTVVVLVAIVLAALVPYPIRIECACELTPKDRRVVDSPLEGVQITEVLRPSGVVDAGDVVMKLDDLELQTRLAGLTGDLEKAQLNMKQAVGEVNRDYWQKEIEKQENLIDLVHSQIGKCQVRSLIAGTILTEQLERVQGRTVQKGEPLFEVADLSRWQLLLEVPQQEIGWVQRGLAEGSAEQVDFYLAAYVERKMRTTIDNAEQISQAPRVGEEGNVFEIRVDVPEDELEEIISGLRSGSTGRAKIETCKRPLGYVLLRKVIRFFRVTMF